MKLTHLIASAMSEAAELNKLITPFNL